jgi:predicted lactoylglutathione lyase
MSIKFPAAVPEIPVSSIQNAAAYYQRNLGFTLDWGLNGGGIAGISRGQCRLFLTDHTFRGGDRPIGHVVTWINLASREEVDELHSTWSRTEARILCPPRSKAWGLHEFTVADLDGNIFRIFYDFATPEREEDTFRRERQ